MDHQTSVSTLVLLREKGSPVDSMWHLRVVGRGLIPNESLSIVTSIFVLNVLSVTESVGSIEKNYWLNQNIVRLNCWTIVVSDCEIRLYIY